MRQAVENFANRVLTSIPENDPPTVYYSQNATGIPAMLQDGAFATNVSESIPNDIGQNADSALFSGAISYLWVSAEKVFIAKTTRPLYYGAAPCDIDIEYNDIGRTCDGDTAYFFAKWQDDSINVGWTPVPGLDKLGNYGMTALQVAQAAETSQAQGGYLKNWTSSDAPAYMQSLGKQIDFLMFNVPFCDMDSLSWPSNYTLPSIGAIYPCTAEVRVQTLFSLTRPFMWPDNDGKCFLRTVLSQALFQRTLEPDSLWAELAVLN